MGNMRLPKRRIGFIPRGEGVRYGPVGMKSTENPFALSWSRDWLFIALVVAFILGIIGVFYLLAMPRQPRTPLEDGLLALLLTAFSTGLSILATKRYAESSYTQSLRDQSVQIARVIFELQNQMQQLTAWVAAKRLELSISGPQQAGCGFLEHVELTLNGFQGMTRTAVAGIAGTIGDALSQYDDFLRQVSRIREEASEKTSEIEQELDEHLSSNELSLIQDRVSKIRDEMESRISELAQRSSLPVPISLRRSLAAICPDCGASNVLETVGDRIIGETRLLACSACGIAFNAHVVQGQRVITRKLRGRIMTTGSEAAIVQTLKLTKAWIEPEHLFVIVEQVVKSAAALRDAGTERSPFKLQEAVLIALRSSSSPVSAVHVRRFMKMMYLARSFVFAPQSPPTFKGQYVNEIERDLVLKKILDNLICRLLNTMSLVPDDAEKVANTIFGGAKPELVMLVRQTISQEAARRAKSAIEIGEPEPATLGTQPALSVPRQGE